MGRSSASKDIPIPYTPPALPPGAKDRRISVLAASSAFKGASRSRDALAGWHPQLGAPDDLLSRDLSTLRTRSVDLIRNNPIAAGAMHVKAQGIVATGLKLHATVDREFLGLEDAAADAWENQAERLFSMWAASKDCHVKRRLNFYEQQDVVIRSIMAAGDHFVQLTNAQFSELPFRLALQHIAAVRVCNPNNRADTDTLVQGIGKTAAGAPTTCHVLDSHPLSQRRSAKRTWTPLPFFDRSTGRPLVLHLYRALADDQTRAIPDLSVIIEPLKQLDRYTDVEIDAAVKNALWALIVETDSGGGIAGLLQNVTIEDRTHWYEENPVNAIGDGARVAGLFPGDRLTSFNPSRPSDAFGEFVDSVLTQIGVALELPREVLTKVFASSYSAARAALLQAIQFFEGRRTWLAMNFCQPVYGAFIDEMVAAGRLAAPGFFSDPMVRAAYVGAEWHGDAYGNIDETKAVDAAVQRIEARLSTRKRECAALTGESWEKVERQLQKEERMIGPMPPPRDRTPQPSASDLDRDDRDAMRESAHG